MKFAAYDDFSIYAIGDSQFAALQNAYLAARDENAQFRTARISDALAERIERDGWDGNRQGFSVVNDEIQVEDDR